MDEKFRKRFENCKNIEMSKELFIEAYKDICKRERAKVLEESAIFLKYKLAQQLEEVKKELKFITVCLKNCEKVKSERWIFEYNKGYRDALLKIIKLSEVKG